MGTGDVWQTRHFVTSLHGFKRALWSLKCADIKIPTLLVLVH